MNAIAHPSALRSHRSHVAPHMPRFRDRADAGVQLARCLTQYRDAHALVLGIPRGGVPVAAEVARALHAELDVVVARKLRSPVSAELGIGAITSDGDRYLDESMLKYLGVTERYVEHVTQVELADARRHETRFRHGAPAPTIAGRDVILVDDGLATGATMIAATRSVRRHHPARLVIAVPVGSEDACAALRHEADEVVCLAMPEPFWAVGAYYEDFRQTEDDEVDQLLPRRQGSKPLRDQLRPQRSSGTA